MRNKRFVFYALAAAAVILCLSTAVTGCSTKKATTVSSTVVSGTGLSLTPFASMKLDVTPGETTTQKMTLSLGAEGQTMQIAVDVMGFGCSLSGAAQGLEPAQDTSPYSARGFITINKKSFQLKPGTSQDISATITIPKKVGAGGRFALIYVHQQTPAGGTGTGSVSSFNIPVLLTIKGSTLTQTGKITGLSTGAVTSGQPIAITTDFQNTGNIYFKIIGQVTVKDGNGQTVATLAIPLTPSSIIPGATREIITNFTATRTLAAGTYTVDCKVTLEDGTLLDESTGTFQITAEYVPPQS